MAVRPDSPLERDGGPAGAGVLHVHGMREPGQRGSAIVEMFKLEDGKIVEHWDVFQPIPEYTDNPTGMF